MRNLFSSVCLVTLVAVGLASSDALAQTININRNPDNGPNAPAGGTSVDGLGVITPLPTLSNWNELGNFQGINSADLEDSTGALTGISVTTTDPGNNQANFTFTQDLGDDGVGGLSLVEGYWAPNQAFGAPLVGDILVTFAGLPATTMVDLAIVSQGDTIGQGGAFTVNGQTEISLGSDPTATSFVEGENFVLFENVLTSTLGELEISFNGTDAPGPDLDEDGEPDFTGVIGFPVINAIQLVIGGVGLPCDVNGNGVCNTSDFEIIRDNLFQFEGGGAALADGDLNFDGVVDFADFRIFQDDPTRVIGTDGSLVAASVAVPEPGTVALIGVAAMLLAPSRRRVGRA